MKKNVGRTDRNVRYVLGGVLLVVAVLGYLGVGFTLGALWAVIAAAVAVLLLATAYTRICLSYRVFGVSTMGRSEEESAETPAAERPA